MSDHIVKMIPHDPFYKAPISALEQAKAFLESQLHCDSVEIVLDETPVFVDCGSNLEKISCPQCSTELDFGWWGDAMDKACEGAFASLDTQTPCCKKMVSLNDLVYTFPCGFACCQICIYNPEPFDKNEISAQLQNIFGADVRIIEAHY